MRIHAKGQEITDIETWFRAAPPKGKKRHWQPYRSARELALAWCAVSGHPSVPPEIRELVDSHPLTAGADFADADITPELRVPIDAYAGEPRNADLAITCSAPPISAGSPRRRIAINVEGKADESFGQTVSSAVRAADTRRRRGEASNADHRARELLRAILGSTLEADAGLGKLRYQLLTATAGTLAFAREQNASVAVLVIHEFSDAANVHTSKAKLVSNARAVELFLSRLTAGALTSLPAGALVGPFVLPGNSFISPDIPLLIGKAVRVLT